MSDKRPQTPGREKPVPAPVPKPQRDWRPQPIDETFHRGSTKSGDPAKQEVSDSQRPPTRK